MQAQANKLGGPKAAHRATLRSRAPQFVAEFCTSMQHGTPTLEDQPFDDEYEHKRCSKYVDGTSNVASAQQQQEGQLKRA